MGPAVSVVIPTYNRAGHVERAVRSVLAQTFGDFELIVVDDGSTDSTPQLIAGFADPRIRYTRNERNRGLPGSRNVGISLARAEWVACLDDDDQWLPEKLERQMRLVSAGSGKGADAVYGGVFYDYPDGTSIYHAPRHRGDISKALLTEPNVVKGGFSCLLFSREAALAVGGFDEKLKMREDYDLQLRLSLDGRRFDFVEGPVLRYRADGGDSLSRKARRRAIGILQVYRKHRRHFESSPRGRHFFDLMHACRFLLQSGHPRLAWTVYRHAVKSSRPPALASRYVREYFVIPAKIGAAVLRAPSRRG